MTFRGKLSHFSPVFSQPDFTAGGMDNKNLFKPDMRLNSCGSAFFFPRVAERRPHEYKKRGRRPLPRFMP
jgi:hypothetical protein